MSVQDMVAIATAVATPGVQQLLKVLAARLRRSGDASEDGAVVAEAVHDQDHERRKVDAGD